jgi:hypothetical protein
MHNGDIRTQQNPIHVVRRVSCSRPQTQLSVSPGLRSIPSPPPPPGRVIRAYHTTGRLPVAVAHAFVLIRPTTGVVTSAHAICGLIPTARGCRCFRR